MNVWYVWIEFHQLGDIQYAVATTRLENPGLLFQGHYIPCEVSLSIKLYHIHDIIVTDEAGVREIEGPGDGLFDHVSGHWKQCGQYGHRIRHGNDSLVTHDFGDKVSGVLEVTGDRHPKSQNQTIFVFIE